MFRRFHSSAFSADNRLPLLFATFALSLAAGCGNAGESGATKKTANSASITACVSTDTTPVTLAVRAYIASASPTPQRYLSAAGTDSAVPEDGFKVLQEKGPTYFYGGDSVSHRKIREKLASVGPYASLLVIYRGKSEAEGGKVVTVKLAGQYIGGEHEGKRAPVKSYAVSCDSTRWKIATSNVEPGS